MIAIVTVSAIINEIRFMIFLSPSVVSVALLDLQARPAVNQN